MRSVCVCARDVRNTKQFWTKRNGLKKNKTNNKSMKKKTIHTEHRVTWKENDERRKRREKKKQWKKNSLCKAQTRQTQTTITAYKIQPQRERLRCKRQRIWASRDWASQKPLLCIFFGFPLVSLSLSLALADCASLSLCRDLSCSIYCSL